MKKAEHELTEEQVNAIETIRGVGLGPQDVMEAYYSTTEGKNGRDKYLKLTKTIKEIEITKLTRYLFDKNTKGTYRKDRSLPQEIKNLKVRDYVIVDWEDSSLPEELRIYEVVGVNINDPNTGMVVYINNQGNRTPPLHILRIPTEEQVIRMKNRKEWARVRDKLKWDTPGVGRFNNAMYGIDQNGNIINNAKKLSTLFTEGKLSQLTMPTTIEFETIKNTEEPAQYVPLTVSELIEMLWEVEDKSRPVEVGIGGHSSDYVWVLNHEDTMGAVQLGTT